MVDEASGPPPTAGDGDVESVVMLSGDLMFASRVRSAAEAGGLKFHFGGKLPEGDLQRVRYVVLDLSTRSGLVGDLAGQCAERCPQAKLIAYGPHVQVDRLREAKAAGIPTVMTNGQFNERLSTMFHSG
jgi:hypothetical protein